MIENWPEKERGDRDQQGFRNESSFSLAVKEEFIDDTQRDERF